MHLGANRISEIALNNYIHTMSILLNKAVIKTQKALFLVLQQHLGHIQNVAFRLEHLNQRLQMVINNKINQLSPKRQKLS